jgi:serine/threonine protein kinase
MHGPNLAAVIDYDARDQLDQPWVASTLALGPSLAAAVTETGPVPPATAGWIALGLARALGPLHQAGLTHDAVTPRNVVLDARGPVLTDAGTSRTALLSGPGSAGEDVLMLGATVLYAATGRSLPDAANGRSPTNADLAGCPSWLAPIVRACLAPEAAARPDAAELHARLAGQAGRQPRTAEYQAVPASRGRFRWPRGRE